MSAKNDGGGAISLGKDPISYFTSFVTEVSIKVFSVPFNVPWGHPKRAVHEFSKPCCGFG